MTLNQVIHFLIKMKTVSKQITTNICPDCAAQRARTANSRPIPSLIRRLIEAQYKGYCAFPHCDKPSTSLHHTTQKGSFLFAPNMNNLSIPVSLRTKRIHLRNGEYFQKQIQKIPNIKLIGRFRSIDITHLDVKLCPHVYRPHRTDQNVAHRRATPMRNPSPRDFFRDCHRSAFKCPRQCRHAFAGGRNGRISGAQP